MKIIYSNTSIGSVAALAKTLSVTEVFLRQVAANPLDHYSIYSIAKRNGGVRVICDPSKELKIVQRRIVRRILSKCVFPEYLFGSVKDEKNPRDFVRNAFYHINAVEVMAFDIQNFFPSTRAGIVKRVFKYFLKLPDSVSDVLVQLTTLNDALPQGAPTSSYLANLVFYDNEHKLVKQLASKGFQYSRLVDDITVSSSAPLSGKERSTIYGLVLGMLSEKKLKIHKAKYKVTNTGTYGEKTLITGLVVEDFRIKLPKEKIRQIGKNVYELENLAKESTTDHEYHKMYGTASGQVALYSRLDLKKSLTYRRVLRSILPTYEALKAKKIRSLCRRFITYSKSHPHQLGGEGYAKKFYKFRHKLNIMKRTDRRAALLLERELSQFKPQRTLASYHE